VSPTGQEREAKGSRRTKPGGFDGPRVPGRCASVGRHAPEDDSVPLHDVVVLRRPVDALRRVVLHPLEITHKPSPCRRRHGGERSCQVPASARTLVRSPSVRRYGPQLPPLLSCRNQVVQAMSQPIVYMNSMSGDEHFSNEYKAPPAWSTEAGRSSEDGTGERARSAHTQTAEYTTGNTVKTLPPHLF